MTTRRQDIAKALNAERVETSIDARKLGPNVTRRMILGTLLENPRDTVTARNGSEMVQKVFQKHREDGTPFKVGEATHLLQKLSTHERGQILKQVRTLDEERSWGKYGKPDELVRLELRANENLVPLTNALTDEQITRSVVDKLGGDDSQLPIPEPTSRDVVRAAYLAAGGELDS